MIEVLQNLCGSDEGGDLALKRMVGKETREQLLTPTLPRPILSALPLDSILPKHHPPLRK